MKKNQMQWEKPHYDRLVTKKNWTQQQEEDALRVKGKFQGGGGGGHSPHDWLRTRVNKKASKGCVFQPYGVVDVFFKKGYFFILHRTLGVTRNKMLETLI